MDLHTDLIERTRAYVEDVLGQPLDLLPSHLAGALPFFVRDRYDILEGRIFDRRCLFLVPTTSDLEAPGGLVKQFQRVANQANATVILLLPALAAYNRKRLVAHRINFIAAGAQLFLPDLAIDLREQVRQPLVAETPEVVTLTPTAQMIVIDAILRPRLHGQIAKDIAETLTVSAMAAGRAMEELRATPFTAMEAQGQSYRLYFTVYNRALWDAARPMMVSPIRKRRGVRTRLVGPLEAGETALAGYTNLDYPTRATLAIHDADWKRYFVDEQVLDPAIPTPALVETWSYPPVPLSEDREKVDPLSLYLTLDQRDERIAIAAEELLEGVFS